MFICSIRPAKTSLLTADLQKLGLLLPSIINGIAQDIFIISDNTAHVKESEANLGAKDISGKGAAEVWKTMEKRQTEFSIGVQEDSND